MDARTREEMSEGSGENAMSGLTEAEQQEKCLKCEAAACMCPLHPWIINCRECNIAMSIYPFGKERIREIGKICVGCEKVDWFVTEKPTAGLSPEERTERCLECPELACMCQEHVWVVKCLHCSKLISVRPERKELVRNCGIVCADCTEERLFMRICIEEAAKVREKNREVFENRAASSEPFFSPEEPKRPAPGEGFLEIAERIAKLVAEKNIAYGSSFDDSAAFLELLWPDGVGPQDYMDMLTIVRIWDKLKRIATNKDALGEDPFSDIVGYCLLSLRRREVKRQTDAEETE